ncbi:MAG TPA: hypothetical protein VLT35_03505, partial [Methanocella sp.]|nr:hypothetical protein [Methanocella sp.]
TGMFYLAGAVLMSLIMGIVLLAVLRRVGLSHPREHTPRYGLRLGLGILLLARGLFGLLTRHYFEYGNVIGGLVLIVIGSAGITVFLTGLTQYIWIAAIIAGGLLVILAGLAMYLFRR